MSSIFTAGPDSMPSPDVPGGFDFVSGPSVAFWTLVLVLVLRGILLILPDRVLQERPRLRRLGGMIGVLVWTLTAVFTLILYVFVRRQL